jgi:hypothetical protein
MLSEDDTFMAGDGASITEAGDGALDPRSLSFADRKPNRRVGFGSVVHACI